MTAVVTVIPLAPDELKAMIADAMAIVVERAAERSGETWRAADLAAHYHVSVRTIVNWDRSGRLPPKIGSRWLRADVLRWDRDRALSQSQANQPA